MRRLSANWSEGIGTFPEERVSRLELLALLEAIRSRAKGRHVSVDSTTLIREDREGECGPGR
ncbi:TPA: hypothetical protein EYP44_01800 [Candidatus Bathyarchaeota archaeon]|nr:hypothetical protein [Candidatus Bathyarchaeota archaeon]